MYGLGRVKGLGKSQLHFRALRALPQALLGPPRGGRMGSLIPRPLYTTGAYMVGYLKL